MKTAPYSRRKDLFRLLLEHGPLSISAIEACIRPPMHKKRIYEALKRLRDQRLVVKRQDKAFERSSAYYQITQEPKGQKHIAEVLGIDLDKIAQPQYRRVEHIHSETCAIWKELLRHIFPGMKVLREHEFAGDRLATAVLKGSHGDVELRPDLMLIAESIDRLNVVSVGVEIERNHKSKERLIRKLKKYAVQSGLDGLIYVCDNTQLSNRLRAAYQSNVVEDAGRIRQYGTNFILFTDASLSMNGSEPEMFNTSLGPVSLRDWMNTLRLEPAISRRDFKFKGPGT